MKKTSNALLFMAVILTNLLPVTAIAGDGSCTDTGVPRASCLCVDGRCVDLDDPGTHPSKQRIPEEHRSGNKGQDKAERPAP